MRILAAALALGLCTACGAIEEIDKGMAIMKSHRKKPSEPETPVAEPTPTARRAANREGPSTVDQLMDWVGKKLEPEVVADPEDRPVRCLIGGKEKFLAKYECELRGGNSVELEWTNSEE